MPSSGAGGAPPTLTVGGFADRLGLPLVHVGKVRELYAYEDDGADEGWECALHLEVEDRGLGGCTP